MTEKILGKITSAEYGAIEDYPFLIGLQLEFRMSNGACVSNGARCCVNISEDCEWENADRDKTITKSVEIINKILKDAKCHYVSQLVGKPVELTIEDNTFQDFRILTEVL